MFPSDRTRKLTLYWSIVFLTSMIVGVTVYGSETNVLHRMALEHSTTLYGVLVIAVIADTALETLISSYVNRKKPA